MLATTRATEEAVEVSEAEVEVAEVEAGAARAGLSGGAAGLHDHLQALLRPQAQALGLGGATSGGAIALDDCLRHAVEQRGDHRVDVGR